MPMISLRVNGRDHEIDVDDPSIPLLYVLRNDLELHGPKFGCGLAQCGSCNVLVDGAAVPSCVIAVSDAEGREITTLEGLGSPENPHPIQRAFIDEQAVQCGYCINGMIITATALLDQKPDPSDSDIKEALAGNLCRCGTHLRIVRAIKRSANEMREGG